MSQHSPGPRPRRDRAESRGLAEGDRAQTVLDYAIAAGIFFVALTFVLGFIPGMFAPFSGTETAQVADRYATSLSTGSLGDPTEPYLLNETCTVEFFDQLNNSDPAPATCRFDTSETTLEGVLGAGTGINVNVSIQKFDGTTVDLTAGGTTETLEAGDDVPNSQAVTTARRVVRLDGRSYQLLVRVW